MTYYGRIISDTLSNLELQNFKISKYIYWGERLTYKILNSHKKHYADISDDEKVLFVLNDINSIMMVGFKVGIVVTDKNLYYRSLKDSFVAGLIPEYYSGRIPLNSIKDISIGRHDIGFGTSYNGHQLIVNGKIIGIVRMGEGYTYDDATIDTLTYIFNCISDGYRPETDEESPEELPDRENEEDLPAADNLPQTKRASAVIAAVFAIILIGFTVLIVLTTQPDSHDSYNSSGSRIQREFPEYEEDAIKVNESRDAVDREILSPDGKYTARVIELDNIYPSGEDYVHEKALVIREVRNNREIEIARHRDAPSPEDCLCEFENIEWSTDSRYIYFTCPVYASGSTVNKIDIVSGKIKHIGSGNYLGYIRYGKYKGCLLMEKTTFENGFREYYGSIVNDENQEIARFSGIDSYSRSELITSIQNMN